MIRQKIKAIIKSNSVLQKAVMKPYGRYCDKKYYRNKTEQYNNDNFHINDKNYCLSAYKREGNVNMWFLLEQAHTNIGDIAIGISDKAFFEKHFPSIKKHFVHEPVYAKYRRSFGKIISKNDIIVLTGGGSLGNFGPHEGDREDVMKRFKKNLIISMPQTMHFTDDRKGEKANKRAVAAYSNCKRLCLVAREKTSFELMKKSFIKTDIFLTPDIVMSLDLQQPRLERDGILLCLRKDNERTLTADRKSSIADICRAYTDKVKYTDTHSESEFVPFDRRETELNAKIDEFKHSKLVITDRLHGMIFCAVSGTPCIALSNYNHKVKGSYEWLKHLNYIRYCDDVNCIEPLVNELYNIGETHYDNSFALTYFEQIINYINEHSDCASLG